MYDVFFTKYHKDQTQLVGLFLNLRFKSLINLLTKSF